MPPLNLLSQISGQQELADLGQASQLDPGLLTPPAPSRIDQLRTGLNSVTRYFGTLFRDQALLGEADRRDHAMQQEQQAAVVNRLLPVLGQAALQRSQQAEHAKAAEAEEKRNDKFYASRMRAAQKGAIDVGGRLTGLTPEQVSAVAKADLDASEGREAKYPEGFRYLSEQDESDIRLDRQRKIDLERDSLRDANAAQRDAATEGRAAAKEAARTAKEAEKQAERDKSDAVKDYRRTREANLSAIRTKSFEVGSNPDDINKAESAELSSVALRAAKNILSDPESVSNLTLLKSIRNDMDQKHKSQWGNALAQSIRDAGITPNDSLKKFLDSLQE